MINSLFKKITLEFNKITLEKGLIYILIAAVLIVFIFVFFLFLSHFTKGIKVEAPNGSEEWGIKQTYEITWKAKGIKKVGIVLFKGKEPKWIAKNVYAELGEYRWKIYPGQEYGDDYWVAIFEYPWKEGNKIDYSDGAFAIIYPELASCDSLSVKNEWPYLPSDLPDLRMVFTTKKAYTGNLEGTEGADKICQKEAEEQGFEGNWRAFLGGDKEEQLAVRRMEQAPRGTKGIFIEAEPVAALIERRATCHRLLGKDFDEFLKKFSNLSMINEEKLGDSFLDDLKNLWLGRIDGKSKQNCISITKTLLNPYASLAEKYSLTATCQNWTKEDKFVQGYPVLKGAMKPPFPTCYTIAGKFTDAVALGGLSSGLTGGEAAVDAFTIYQGKYCDTRQKLLCIEE